MPSLKDLNLLYIPLLSLRRAEMAALEELPEKDKNLIHPLITLKGWVGSHELKSSIQRIEKSFGNRTIILDIDETFPSNCKTYPLGGGYSRKVFQEIHDLLSPRNGYENWYIFFETHKNYIPVMILKDLSEFTPQLERLKSLGRGVVLRLKMRELGSEEIHFISHSLTGVDGLLLIFDFDNVSRESLAYSKQYANVISKFINVNPNIDIAVSGTSFPSSFGTLTGEISIFERMLYQRLVKELPEKHLIYSDWGSTRAESLTGGGGAPPPRIDYACQNQIFFIKKEFFDSKNAKNEKKSLYMAIAKEIIGSEFWNPDLHLWGRQMIEKTSYGDEYAINSPSASTAVRINLHLYHQLHYGTNLAELDTDEEWTD